MISSESPSSGNSQQPGAQPDGIDVHDSQALEHWAGKLDVTDDQLKQAVQAVGDKASDVEMELKGSRSTTNADRMEEAGGM